MPESPYETLGVARDATANEIKRAYRKLAVKHHPDKAGGDAEKFQAINAANELLEDPVRKKAIDQGRHDPAAGGGGGGGGGARGYQPERTPKRTMQVTLEQLRSGDRIEHTEGRRVVLVTVDPGLPTPYTMRLKGMLEPTSSLVCCTTGDLDLTIELEPDAARRARLLDGPAVSRVGDGPKGAGGADLALRHPVTLKEALCGKLDRPIALFGEPLQQPDAPATGGAFLTPGVPHRHIGMGLPIYRDGAGRRGDLLVEYELVFPEDAHSFFVDLLGDRKAIPDFERDLAPLVSHDLQLQSLWRTTAAAVG